MTEKPKIPQLLWLDPLKALALLAILLNHFVEEFGFPQDYSSYLISFFQFLGWLGDNGPGVFILLSGFGLMWAAVHRPEEEMSFSNFYKRRLLRIFPLYIAMHFVILGMALFIPNSNLNFGSPKTLLSILGLRFTDSLFFYISPAWWFVWLIIQLYFVFPLLHLLMKRVGVKQFLIITFAFTFTSRLLGILGIRYSHSLYYWMTGIFFGTRLAEFCAGMAIAFCLSKPQMSAEHPAGVKRVLLWAFPLYVLGLLCSLTWAGSIISNLLVSLGMAGLFYTVWDGLIKKVSILTRLFTWIGIESYSVYLFHQTPLQWTGLFLHGNLKCHLIAAVFVLVISFPIGILIDKIVTRFVAKVKTNISSKSIFPMETVVL